MTKNVTQMQIDQYVHILNLQFVEGRAAIAQNLHLLAQGSRNFANDGFCVGSVCVCVDSRGRSVAPGRKSVDGEEPSRGRSQISPGVSFCEKRGDSTCSLDRLHIDNVKVPLNRKGTAEERHVDSWSKDGKDGRWTRVHRSARKALFTPFKVAGGPGTKTPLKKLRVTRGQFLDSGRTFKIIDDWSVRANAHRLLEGTWLGTTDFRETSECIDDDSDEEVDHKEAEAEEEEEDDKEGPEYFALSPTKSSGHSSHPEDLLTLKLEAKGQSDRGRLALHARGQPQASESFPISLSIPSRGRGLEGECRNPGMNSIPPRSTLAFATFGPLGSQMGSQSDPLRTAPLSSQGGKSAALPPRSPLHSQRL
jgi:hypothetical protein